MNLGGGEWNMTKKDDKYNIIEGHFDNYFQQITVTCRLDPVYFISPWERGHV